MTKVSESFNTSCDENFCVQLELQISLAFANSNHKNLKYFWCDGVLWAPFFNPEVNKSYLSSENISKTGQIETTAWIGVSGQDTYEMIIKLGPKALKKYEAGSSMVDCIPGNESIDWIKINTDSHTVKISLL